MPVLNIFGDLETFTTEHLYPYRYVIMPLLVAAVLGGLYAAYRLGAHVWVRRKPMLSAAIGVPLVVTALVAGNYFLSPLWERSHLEEASPLAAAPLVTSTSGAGASPEATASATTPLSATPPADASPTPTESPPVMAFQPVVAYTGSFIGADDFHFGQGDALIIETEPGVYVLRLENFSVRNGPDLFVYLSEHPEGDDVDEALNLGALKATDGAFNYEIPPHVDVSRVKSAVVWCRQFSTLFTHASLM